jgi:hypothetical protein
MVKIYENSVNCAVFVAASNIYASGCPIGDSANCVKTLWGLVAPLLENANLVRSVSYGILFLAAIVLDSILDFDSLNFQFLVKPVSQSGKCII